MKTLSYRIFGCIAMWFLLVSLLGAQQISNFSCPSDEYHKEMLRTNSHYAEQYAQFGRIYRQNYQESISSNLSIRGNPPVYRIPVVVHVIHDCAPYGSAANPTDETIQEIIQETTDRLRHRSGLVFGNPFSGVDTEIELCLASADPLGRYTNGIVRHQDASIANLPNDPEIPSEYINLIDPLKSIVWPTGEYYNLFIIQSLPDAAGVYLGGLDATLYNSTAFWSGLICHETGHYLSLAHPFDNGGCKNDDCLQDNDGVCDTPPKDAPGSLGNPCGEPGNSCTTDGDDVSANNPYRDISLGGNGDKPDLLENYMDYTGGCWEAFTQGQSLRMRSYIEANRMALVNNATNCDQTLANNLDLGIVGIFDNYRTCDIMYTAQVDVKNFGEQNVLNFVISIEVNGTLTLSRNIVETIAPGETITIDLDPIALPAGKNMISFFTADPNGAPDNHTTNDAQCVYKTFQSSGASIPYQEDFSSCAFDDNISIGQDNQVRWSIGNDDNLESCQSCYASVVGGASSDERSSITLPLLSLVGANNPVLKFDFGYLPRYDFIINELSIEISADCMAPTRVYSQSGLEIATNDPPAFTNGEYMVPSCDQFKTMEIDLTAFVGEENVLITFIGFGRWWSPLFLDNISVEESSSTCNPDVNGIIMVTNANDAGSGSLREAIECANSSPGPNAIHFDIPGGAAITLDSILPATTDDAGLIIDGSTQPGMPPVVRINCDQIPMNNSMDIAVLEIISNQTDLMGLQFDGLTGNPAAGQTISYVSIGSIAKSVEGVGIGAIGKSNLFGNVSGTGADPNSLIGVNIINATSINIIGNGLGIVADLSAISNNCTNCTGIFASSMNQGLITIGGTGQGNIIGGWSNGMVLEGVNATYEVFGNYFGTDPSAQQNLGNSRSGLTVNGGNVQIGGSLVQQRNAFWYNQEGIILEGFNTSVEGNIISLNQGSGVLINFRGNDINDNGNHLVASNQIFENAIGVTLSNAIPNVLIVGNEISANDLEGIKSANDPLHPSVAGQQYTNNSIFCNAAGISNESEGLIAPIEPFIESATFSTVEGTSIANGTIELYLHLECPTSSCQGFEFLGITNSDASGAWSYNFPVSLPAKAQITATVTDVNASTSEFAECYRLCNISAFDLGRDTFICEDESFELSIGTPGSSIIWSNGETDSSITISEPGVYSVTVSDGTVACEEADTIEVFAADLEAVAMTGEELGCMDTILLSGSQSSITEVEYMYWETVDGNIIGDNNAVGIQIDQPGTYILWLRTPSGTCEDSDTLVIAQSGNAPLVIIESENSQFNLGCGVSELMLLGTSDQTDSIAYEWTNGNGEVLGSSEELLINQSGAYYLTVSHIGNGCVGVDSVIVTEENINTSYEISLGPEETIALGDSVVIAIQTNIPEDQIASITWSPVNCIDCDMITLTPDQETLVQVTITDINGCILQAEKLILVDVPESNYFVPNIFSPNGDNQNDYFTIYGDATINQIAQLSIFDRHGSLVWQTQNIPPSQLSLGWDGSQNGQMLNPGVYVYRAVLTKNNGLEEVVFGNVTLVR